MPFYMSYRSVPELAPIQEPERKAIWLRAYRKGFWGNPYRAILTIFMLVALPIFFWALLASYLGLSFWPRQLIAVALAGIGGGIVGHLATQSALPPRDEIASRNSQRGT